MTLNNDIHLACITTTTRICWGNIILSHSIVPQHKLYYYNNFLVILVFLFSSRCKKKKTLSSVMAAVKLVTHHAITAKTDHHQQFSIIGKIKLKRGSKPKKQKKQSGTRFVRGYTLFHRAAAGGFTEYIRSIKRASAGGTVDNNNVYYRPVIPQFNIIIDRGVAQPQPSSLICAPLLNFSKKNTRLARERETTPTSRTHRLFSFFLPRALLMMMRVRRLDQSDCARTENY